MADSELKNLTEKTDPASGDWVPIQDETTGDLQKAKLSRIDQGHMEFSVDTTRMAGASAMNASFGLHSTEFENGSCVTNRAFFDLRYFPKGFNPTELSINVASAVASSEIYLGAYTMSPDDGLPLDRVLQYGPFDGSVAAEVTITGQTQTLAEGGWLWAAGLTIGGAPDWTRLRSASPGKPMLFKYGGYGAVGEYGALQSNLTSPTELPLSLSGGTFSCSHNSAPVVDCR